MSTLFMIGNGFDINCGMKTRYTDVYKKYVNEESKSDIIKEFKNNISGNFETWGDFEMAMAEYAQKLDSEAEFLECIRDFSSYMETYLIEESNLLKRLLANEQVFAAGVKEIEQSFRNFYTDISHNIDVTMESRSAAYFRGFEAISFNYTNIFDVFWEAILKKYQVNKEVIHIHGVLQDGPVFGVDNVEQIKAKFNLSRKGKRGFVKPIFNGEYDVFRVNEAQKKIKKALTICAYGMSVGESDLSWRNEIIEWLKADKEHHLFVYRYTVSQAEYKTVTEKMDVEEDAKEQLLSEWGINDFDTIFDQIHIPCGKNIFNVDTVLKEELHKIDIKKKSELKKKIEQGEAFVEKNARTVIAM